MALPLPTSEQLFPAGGQLVRSLQGLNALKRQILENQYYAPIAQSNAMSKSAYAQYAPAEAIAKFLSTPGVASSMTPEQYNAIKDQFQRYVSQPLINPFTQVSNNQGLFGMGKKMLNSLLGMLGGEQNIPNQKKISMPYSQQNQIIPSLSNHGNEIYGTPEQVNAISNMKPGQTIQIPGLQIDRTASILQPQGTMGGYNPPAVAKAQEAGLTTGSTTEASVNRNTWNEMHKNSAKEALQSRNTMDLASKFSNAYDLLEPWERGPIIGSAKALTTNAQDADTATQGLADAVARAQQQGHITQIDRGTYSSMKPGRYMTKDAKKHAIDFLEGMNERIMEHATFNEEADKEGYTPQEANSIWLNYINKNPFYDSKHHELIEENFNKWPEYLEPEKVKEALHPTPGKKSLSKKESDPLGWRT